MGTLRYSSEKKKVKTAAERRNRERAHILPKGIYTFKGKGESIKFEPFPKVPIKPLIRCKVDNQGKVIERYNETPSKSGDQSL